MISAVFPFAAVSAADSGDGSEPKQTEKKKLTASTVVSFLFAFIGALALWFYVSGYDSPTFEKTFSGIVVDLKGEALMNGNSGMVVTNGDNVSIDVTVKGKKSDINKMYATDITAYVDVSALSQEGNHTLQINFEVPNGTSVSDSSSQHLYVTTVKKTVREYTIKPIISDVVLGSDLTLEYGKIICTPSKVAVQGSATMLESISEVRAYVTLGETSGSKTARAAIVLTDGRGNVMSTENLTLSATIADIYIPVYQTKNVPVKVRLADGVLTSDSVKTECSPSFITLKGEPSVLENITEYTVDIYETEINKTKTETFPLPKYDGVEVTADGEKITVTASLVDIGTRYFTLSNENIVFLGADSGLTFTPKTPSLDLMFKGVAEKLLFMTENDFTVTVSVPDIEQAGEYTRRVNVSIGGGNDGIYIYGEYDITFVVDGEV